MSYKHLNKNQILNTIKEISNSFDLNSVESLELQKYTFENLEETYNEYQDENNGETFNDYLFNKMDHFYRYDK